MRLLKVTHDSVFKLSTFDDHDVPAYAILSHTWGRGEEDEVTFNDIKEGSGKGKQGFRKLMFCNDHANAHGLGYFWVDTCCIDRSSSTELTEAINSMFRWYERAERCYVYLADVAVRTTDGQLSLVQWESAFRSSRWFTRGWTLQELLVPSKVDFYSRDQVYLGDRVSTMALIHGVTGIALDVLESGDLSGYSVEERLTWAEKRQTTKPEDRVYCLLGLCGVFMPLLYGEGYSNALRRLKNELVSDKPDAKHGKTSPFIVPLDRNPHFTGRELELARLEELLFLPTSHPAKTAIEGLGGVGKTQLAIELLYRAKARYPDLAVFWIPATDPESLLQAYRVIADELDIPGRDSGDVDVRVLVKTRLSMQDAGRWLLVFDNLDNLDVWTSKSTGAQTVPQLIECIPKHTSGSILFTTRNRKIAVKVAQQNVLHIVELEAGLAADFLRACLIEPPAASDQRQVELLVEQLTHLPLAIRQASAYINANCIPLEDYSALLAEQDQSAIELLGEEFEDEGRYQGHRNPVAVTWLVSFEQIQRDDPLAAEYLSFMACIEPKAVPESLLPPGPSRKKEMDAVGTLCAYSFVTRRIDHRTLDLHRLVHLTTRNWLIENGHLGDWKKIATKRLNEKFPRNLHADRPLWRQYLPHARRALMFKDDEIVLPRADLAIACARCFRAEGRYKEAEHIFIESLEVNKRIFGDEQPRTIDVTEEMVITYLRQGRWKEAEQLGSQVLETRKRVLGMEHPDMLDSMQFLADAIAEQGRLSEAEQLEMQALGMGKRLLGEAHSKTLLLMGNLALTYQEQGKLAEAEQLGSQCLEMQKRNLGASHPRTLIATSNLALTYYRQGRLDEAERLNLHVLESRRRKLRETHPDTLTSMNNLACVLNAQGRHTEAIALMHDCVSSSTYTLGREHPRTVASAKHLANWRSESNGIGVDSSQTGNP